MGFYRVVLFWRQFGHGWTETFYRAADSARLASELGGLEPFLGVRAAGVVLQSVRAQEVAGLRRIFLRVVNQRVGGDVSEGDLSHVSARLFVRFREGGGRQWWARGLRDRDVRRDRFGRFLPGGDLVSGLRALGERLLELGLCGRRLIGKEVNPWRQVLRVEPDERTRAYTRVKVTGKAPAAAGEYVYFGGKAQPVLEPERGYLVLETDEGSPWFTIAADFPPELAGYWAHQPFRARKLAYDYPRLEEPELRDFSTFQTHAAYDFLSWAPADPMRSPINPCGRPVDMGRRVYSVQMGIFRDDPSATVAVQWYRLPDGGDRAGIPWDHPFGSREWELPGDYPTQLGERFEGRERFRGRAPVELEGRGVCGSLDQWMNGCLTTDTVPDRNPLTGSPCCCGRGTMVLVAGNAAGPSAAAAVGLPADVEVPCCPGKLFSRQLRWTFITAGGRFAPLLGQSIILDWDAGNQYWRDPDFSQDLPGGFLFAAPLVACQPFLLLWSWAYVVGLNTRTGTWGASQCEPFLLTGGDTWDGDTYTARIEEFFGL